MEPRIIPNCRVCLEDFDEIEMIDLFAEKEINDVTRPTIKLSKKLEFCCGIKIRESNEMPSKICLKCFDIIRIWYNFRQLCINSQIYLESMCKERHGSENFDDNDYLEYLLDDLQIFRMEVQKDNPQLDIDIIQTDSDNEYVCSDEYLQSIKNEADESDADVIQMVENIKTETDGDFKVKEKLPKQENQMQIPKKSKKSENRRKMLPKKRFRPPSPSTYMCSICGNVYTKKTSFSYHMSIHSNSRPHECELCGKSFRQTSELKNHMRRHTGERPYKCSYCDRHFIDRSEKHRHERIHTNTRPYVCKECGKSFMYSAILKNHTKLHSGEKNYSCVVCRKSFTLQHQLKAHLQTITHKQKEAQGIGVEYDVLYE